MHATPPTIISLGLTLVLLKFINSFMTGRIPWPMLLMMGRYPPLDNARFETKFVFQFLLSFPLWAELFEFLPLPFPFYAESGKAENETRLCVRL